MKILVLLFSYFAFFFAISQQRSGPYNDRVLKGSSINRQLTFVGRIGPKSYFTEPAKMNWTEAKSLCEASLLQLATIETELEYSFLTNTSETGAFTGVHWVAARDSHAVHQFHWEFSNGTEAEINVEMSLYVSPQVQPPLTCGAVFPMVNESLRFDLYPCSMNTFAVLCETP